VTAPTKGPLDVPVPSQWWLVKPGPADLCGTTIDRMPQREGPDLYAVHWRSSDLSKTGDWDWRPIPSSRTDEWLAEHRFATFDEAVAAYRAAAQKEQKP